MVKGTGHSFSLCAWLAAETSQVSTALCTSRLSATQRQSRTAKQGRITYCIAPVSLSFGRGYLKTACGVCHMVISALRKFHLRTCLTVLCRQSRTAQALYPTNSSWKSDVNPQQPLQSKPASKHGLVVTAVLCFAGRVHIPTQHSKNQLQTLSRLPSKGPSSTATAGQPLWS